MKIEGKLIMYGSDLYPVKKESFVYKDFSKALDLEVVKIEYIGNNTVICNGYKIELKPNQTCRVTLSGDEVHHYEVEMVLIK